MEVRSKISPKELLMSDRWSKDRIIIVKQIYNVFDKGQDRFFAQNTIRGSPKPDVFARRFRLAPLPCPGLSGCLSGILPIVPWSSHRIV